MPTYVYKFVETGETIEVQQSFTDDALTEAAHPGTGVRMPVKKVFTPVGVTFRGDGFYKTDSRGKPASTSSGSSSDGGSGGGDAGSTSTADKKTTSDSGGSPSSGGSSGAKSGSGGTSDSSTTSSGSSSGTGSSGSAARPTSSE